MAADRYTYNASQLSLHKKDVRRPWRQRLGNEKNVLLDLPFCAMMPMLSSGKT